MSFQVFCFVLNYNVSHQMRIFLKCPSISCPKLLLGLLGWQPPVPSYSQPLLSLCLDCSTCFALPFLSYIDPPLSLRCYVSALHHSWVALLWFRRACEQCPWLQPTWCVARVFRLVQSPHCFLQNCAGDSWLFHNSPTPTLCARMLQAPPLCLLPSR